ncbi:hypothetical protein PYW07_012514 [Mythimna separata]|uniref:Uncharacterized protein n=1 Tax=Mythimna separata TaxID=271217 RepID=A0AAD7YLC1_MYTSE|nr:hypothetical protein PYW07_012514 [Mythimna separata]
MMSGIRTPVKKAPANTQSRSPQTGTEEAASLSSSLVTGAIANKTISPMRTMTVSPTKTVGRQVTPTSKPTRTLIAEAETRTQSLLTTAGPRRVSTDRPLTLAVSTYVSRTKEASVCITKIRKHLEDSRNLKKEIKTAVVEASERLYQLGFYFDSRYCCPLTVGFASPTNTNMFRTPAKKDAGSQGAGGSPRSTEKAGTSLPSVRRSIGEWEAGRAELKPKSPANPKPDAAPAATQKIPSASGARRASVETGSPGNKPESKYPNLTVEARACLSKAKLHLGNSRNLKTEIKTEVMGAINRLYEIVKESENRKRPVLAETITATNLTYQPTTDEGQRTQTQALDVPTELVKQLMENLQQHNRALEECQQHTQALSEQLKLAPRYVAGHGPTFAEIAAGTRQKIQESLHSVVVSSLNDKDTGAKLWNSIAPQPSVIRVPGFRRSHWGSLENSED